MTDLYEIEGFNSDDPDAENALHEKIALGERAGEIYRQQLRYMQDHLASLRSLIQDKENIIENLLLRYDLGIINQESKHENIASKEIDRNELHQKSWYLAQMTILENFELREANNEVRDENFHLRNEIYELQEKINKLEKKSTESNKSHDINGNFAENQDWNSPNEIYGQQNKINKLEKEIEDTNDDNKSDDSILNDEAVNKLESDRKSTKEQMDSLRTAIRSLSLSDDGIPSNYKMGAFAPLIDSKQEKQEKQEKNEKELENIEHLKMQLQGYEAIKEEVIKLRRIKMNVTQMRKLFGGSLKSLIPYQLNDNALSKYCVLFDGYYRNVFGDSMISRDVIKLISFYFPIFWTLEAKPSSKDNDENDLIRHMHVN